MSVAFQGASLSGKCKRSQLEANDSCRRILRNGGERDGLCAMSKKEFATVMDIGNVGIDGGNLTLGCVG